MAGSEESVKKLKEACDAAYGANKDSCSNAVWDVIKAVQDDKFEYRQANTLIDYLTVNWTEVSLDDGHKLANQGKVVVGGKKETGSGHVILIYPGDLIFNGGYQYYWKTGKKYLTLPGTKQYPRCLSTSMGSWPGAMSKGDKTVWDPWGKDSAFEEVRFWAPPDPFKAK